MMFDRTYIVLVLPMVILSLIASVRVKTAYAKYAKVFSRRGYTAEMAARRILDANGLYQVQILPIAGDLTDHYDPRTGSISLSQSVYGSSSVAAIGVAAHEAGHAIQHAEGYAPLKLRNAIIPATQLGSKLSVPLIILGLLLGFTGLAYAGILLFGLVVLFQLLTLPTEFNASRRAVTVLSEGMLDEDEVKDVKKVLSAAALTYVAAMLTAVANLLRFLLIVNGGSGRKRR